jgi:hypothetical protein
MASVAASLLLSKWIAVVYGPQTPSTDTMSVTVVEESVDTQEVAQTAFSQMKGATGKDGQYSIWDDFRFKVVLPIASIFRSLSADETTQKALYEATCKVENAFQKYVVRRADLATAYVDSKKKMADLEPLKNSTEQAYWKSLKTDKTGQVTTLEEFIQYVETDKEIKEARLAMLTGFKDLKHVLDRTNPSMLAEALNDLAKGEDKRSKELLKSLRIGFAQECLDADLKVSGTVTTFIDKFKEYVDNAVEIGLGTKAEVENDFASVIATYLNAPGEEIARREELATYVERIEAAVSSASDGQAIQDFFKTKLEALVNGKEPITASVMKGLKYERKDMSPIYLSEFIGNAKDVQNFTQLLEHSRLNLRAYSKAQAQVTVQASLVRANADMLRFDSTTKLSLQDVAVVATSDSGLKEDELREMLGKKAADTLLDAMAQRKELQKAIDGHEKQLRTIEADWNVFEQHHASKAAGLNAEGKIAHACQHRTAQTKMWNGRDTAEGLQELAREKQVNIQRALENMTVTLSDEQLLKIGKKAPGGSALHAAITEALQRQPSIAKKRQQLDADRALHTKLNAEAENVYVALFNSLKACWLVSQNSKIFNDENNISLNVGKLIDQTAAAQLETQRRESLKAGRVSAAEAILHQANEMSQKAAQDKANSKGVGEVRKRNVANEDDNVVYTHPDLEIVNEVYTNADLEYNEGFNKTGASVHTDSVVNPKAMPLSSTNILYTDTSKGAPNPIKKLTGVSMNSAREVFIDGDEDSDRGYFSGSGVESSDEESDTDSTDVGRDVGEVDYDTDED